MPRPTLLAIALFAACSSPPPVARAPQPAAEIRHSVLNAGRLVGAQVETRAPDGSRLVKFHFNDRGRGPELTIRVWEGDDDLAERVEVRGVDYYKVRVQEDFSLRGSQARWQSSSERGEQQVRGPAFYLGMNSAPEETARLVRAALASDSGRLAVLPAGEAQVSRLGTHELVHGSQRETVTLYAIAGIWFEPDMIWLDSRRSLFAGITDWYAIVREGWEGSVDGLRTRQRELGQARLADMARRLTHRPEGPLVFRDVAVFDAERRRLIPAQTVVVRGERIAAVGPADQVKVPADAEVIDGKGHTLLPGLWDMHVHIGDGDGILQLAGGVTSARDLGNNVDQLVERKRAFDEGRILGPRLIYSGFIDGPGPYAGPIGTLVDTEEEMRAAIADYAGKGVEQIKLYSSVDPKLVPVAVAEAKKRGLRVSGHVPNGMRAAQFVEQGADELQHINFLVLNFLDVPDTRTPERFHAVGREAAALDLASPKVQAFIRLLRDRKTVVDPTLNAFEDNFMLRAGEMAPALAPVASRLPPAVQRAYRRGGFAPKGMEQRYRDSFAQLVRYVGELHRSGVTIVAGTDGIAGFALHRELELYVQAGIAPADVLQICTLGAARLMKRADRLGSIAPGKLADLVMVEGDPTRRIQDIRKPVVVVKGGAVYRSAELYGAIGVK